MASPLQQLDGFTRYFKALASAAPQQVAQAHADQMPVLRTLLESSTFSMEDAAAAVEKLSTMGLSEANAVELTGLVRIKPLVGAGAASVSRRAMQNYTNLHLYLTQAMWDLLLSDEGAESKAHALTDHALNLGLRCPTEPTMQHVVALANFSDKSFHSLMPSILHEAFKSMKMRIKAACNKAIKLDYPHSTTLPVNWKEHNSDWLNRAFVGDAPVPSKIPHSELAAIVAKIPLRSSKVSVYSRSSTQSLGLLFDPQSCVAMMTQHYLRPYAAPPAQEPLRIQFNAPSSASRGSALPMLQLPPSQSQADTEVQPQKFNDGKAEEEAATQSKAAHEEQNVQLPKKVPVLTAVTQIMDAMAGKKTGKVSNTVRKQSKAACKKLAGKCDVAVKAVLDEASEGKTVAKKACKKGRKVKSKPIHRVKKIPSASEQLKLAPTGCAKCRNKPGCTPSCWKGRLC